MDGLFHLMERMGAMINITKTFFVVLLGMAFLAGLNAQNRLANPNDPNAKAVSGQAEIIIDATNADRDIAVWINGQIAAHVRPKTSEKIIVRNGQNFVEAADTTLRGSQWNTGSKKNITVNSNSDCVTINTTTRYGALLNLTIKSTTALGGGSVSPAAPVAAAPAARPAPAPAPAPVAAPTRPATPPPPVSQGVGDIDNAVYRAAWAILENLPPNSTVAVLSIASDDPELAEFVIEELVYTIVSTRKFKVVDRRSLDAIQAEARFQYSGDVDDNSAVRIGQLLGANVVITGSVGGTGTTRRIRAKALNVQTAEILAMASERY